MRRGVDCLTSFFEISGHIIECDITSHSSSITMVSAAERPERGRIAARSQSSMMTQTSSARTRADIHRETQKFLFDNLAKVPEIPGI